MLLLRYDGQNKAVGLALSFHLDFIASEAQVTEVVFFPTVAGLNKCAYGLGYWLLSNLL